MTCECMKLIKAFKKRLQGRGCTEPASHGKSPENKRGIEKIAKSGNVCD